MTSSEIQNMLTRRSTEGIGLTSPRVRKAVALIRRLAGGRRGWNILDLGCHSGVLASLTGEHRVYGADVCPKFFPLARLHGYTACAECDLETEVPPFAGIEFDLVFLGECVEHVADTDFLLANIYDRLKPGGSLVMTFPNLRTPVGLLMLLFLNRVPMFGAGYGSAHVHDFTTSAMRTALTGHGFAVKSMRGGAFCVSRNPEGVLPGLAHWLPSWASMVILHAEKPSRQVLPPDRGRFYRSPARPPSANLCFHL